jgi:ATP-dependent protease ClpP protease subunit
METITITGEIDKAAAERLRRDLDAAHGDDVVIAIDSLGGNFIAGLKMYADLTDYKGGTVARIVHAGSAATLPLCGCDRAVNTARGTVFVHAPTAAAVKDIGLSIGDLREAIGSLERTTTIIATIYAAKNSMGWPTHKAINVYRNIMRREGGTTWGPGGQPPLCDSCESDGHRPISNVHRREPTSVLAQVVQGGFLAGVGVGARMAAATIAKNGRRRQWTHADGSRYGGPFANQRDGVD